MNTITPTDQDHFIISFVHWLFQNFEEISFDQYRDINDMGPLEKNTVLRTVAECLDLFRKQQIPPLPLLATDTEHKILALAEEATRKNNALFGGYRKIQTLLQTSNSLTKQQLSDIIIDTMTQIS